MGGAGGMGGTGGMPLGICGDNNIDLPSETCDDGNTNNGDGCSSMCLSEPTNACPGNAVVLAPPGVVLQSNTDTKGDEYDPYCGPNGLNDVYYAVTPMASGTLKATLSLGNVDKSLTILSTCGVGLAKEAADLGCVSSQMEAVKEIWVHAGTTYYIVVDAPNGVYDLNLELNACGDGVKSSKEQCEMGDAGCTGCVLCNAGDEFWDPNTKHCYKASTAGANFRNAHTSCVDWGGELVGIGTKAEFDFLAAAPKITTDSWSGGYVLTAGCSHGWINGEPWRSNWVDGQPSANNENCVMMRDNSAQAFDDKPCNESHDYVCERVPAGYCGDGIVQPGEECDDANAVNLDGCSMACKRDEPCAAITGAFIDNGHCYWVDTGGDTWAGAKGKCESKGGYLATISSQAEQTLLHGKVAANNADAWIGGQEGGFNNTEIFWEASSTNCSYSAGLGLNSNPDKCIRLSTSNTWRDSSCTSAMDFICERDWQ